MNPTGVPPLVRECYSGTRPYSTVTQRHHPVQPENRICVLYELTKYEEPMNYFPEVTTRCVAVCIIIIIFIFM